MAVEKRKITVVEQIVRFLLAGLPSFALAVPLNYLLVDHAQLNKSLAYGIVLFCQVVTNFFVCYFFVFERKSNRTLLQQLWQFVVGIMAFRCGDWAVYSLATAYLGVNYLLMQILNVTLFSLMKFSFAKRVMGESPPEGAEKGRDCAS